MKFEVEIPEPQFRVGDVVEEPHEYGSIFLVVVSLTGGGTWKVRDLGDGLLAYSDSGTVFYNCAVQEGSTYINPSCEAIRPGTVFVHTLDNLHGREARKVPWGKPVVGPDTQENIDERKRAWTLPADRPGEKGEGL